MYVCMYIHTCSPWLFHIAISASVVIMSIGVTPSEIGIRRSIMSGSQCAYMSDVRRRSVNAPRYETKEVDRSASPMSVSCLDACACVCMYVCVYV